MATSCPQVVMANLELRRARRIGLYGPFGWGNLGDASIQEAMLWNIRQRVPDAEFVGISLNPENTEDIHGIPSVPILRRWRPRRAAGSRVAAAGAPAALGSKAATTAVAATPAAVPPAPTALDRIRGAVKATPVVYPALRTVRAWAEPAVDVLRELRFLGRSLSFLRDVDMLVISGGGQLSDDWGGPWDHPYSLLTWMGCARLAGSQVYVVSVGAGPFRARLTGVFLRAALRLAHYRSYRDVESHAFLARFGVTLPGQVYPDLAFSLPCKPPPLPPRGSTRKPVVGISPLSYFYPVKGAWPEHDRVRYDRYLETLLALGSSVVDEGHPVVVFSSQIRNDRYAFDDLLKALRAREVSGDAEGIQAVPTRNLPHLLEQIAACDIVVTSRLHGVILSYLHHKAVISLSYDPKIDAVMRVFGQTDYCLDIDRCTPDLLLERFRQLRGDLDATRERIRVQATRNRELLEEQYDRLFGRRLERQAS